MKNAAAKKEEEASAKEEVTSIKLEVTDEEGSILPEDSASNVGGNVAVPRHTGSTVSSGDVSAMSTVPAERMTTSPSVLSVSGSRTSGPGGHCFLAHALFKAEGGFVPACQLKRDSFIFAANSDAQVQVKAIAHMPPALQDIIELRAGGDCMLKVTADHRVLVKRGPKSQTIAAHSLRSGDTVFSSKAETVVLREVRRVRDEVATVEITFFPDEAVAAFEPPPPAILSKGHGWPKTTRRSKRRGREADRLSIPDTENSYD